MLIGQGSRFELWDELHWNERRESWLQASEERFRRQYEGNPIPTFSWRYVDDDFVLEDYQHHPAIRGAVAV